MYFVYYWHVVMILFSAGLCSPYFVPSILQNYLYVFLRYDFSCFCISGFKICFEFNVILKDLITFNFLKCFSVNLGNNLMSA